MGCAGELEPPVLLQKWEMGCRVGGGVKELGADGVSCPQAQVGAAGVSGFGSYVQEGSRQGAGSEQLHYLGYRGAIYLRGLTCFCRLGELCGMENR